MKNIMNTLIFVVALALSSQANSYVVDSININSVRPQERSLFLRNKPNAIKVEKILLSKGFTNRKCLLAIHANTWHESKWNPNTVAGNFVGIFQIGGRGTMGQGTTPSQRKDITFSTNLISSREDFRNWYKRHSNSNSTVGQAARDFAARVLRCASRHVSSRGSTAYRWGRNPK